MTINIKILFILFLSFTIIAQDENPVINHDVNRIEELRNSYNQLIDDLSNDSTQNEPIKYEKIQRFQFPEKYGYYKKGILYQSWANAQISRVGDIFLEDFKYAAVIGGIAWLIAKNKSEAFMKWSIGSFCVFFAFDLFNSKASRVKKTKLIKYEGEWVDPNISGFINCNAFWYRTSDFNYLTDWEKVQKSKSYDEWKAFVDKCPDRFIAQQTKDNLSVIYKDKANTENQITAQGLQPQVAVEEKNDSDLKGIEPPHDIRTYKGNRLSLSLDLLNFALWGPTFTGEFTVRIKGKSEAFGVLSGYRCVSWGWAAREGFGDDLKASSYTIPLAFRMYTNANENAGGGFMGLYLEFGTLKYEDDEDEIIRAYGLEIGYKFIDNGGMTVELSTVHGILEYGPRDDLIKGYFPTASIKIGFTI
jgi:hypothetical protein